MKQIKKLIEIARALKPARQDMREFHVCGIFKGNKLISLAHNTRKTHPFALTCKYPYPEGGSHAEMLAILRGKQEDYFKHTLIVIRINNKNEIDESKPCKYCEYLIRKLNFSNVIYSNQFHIFQTLF